MPTGTGTGTDKDKDTGDTDREPDRADEPLGFSPPSPSTSADNGPVVSPLPRLAVFLIALVLYAASFPINCLFSFLPFMVEHLSPGLPRSELGYRAGVLASAYSLGTFCSSYIFGRLSDRWGRRQCTLIGLAATVVTSVLFGCSLSFEMAVLARFLGGALNGNNSLSKTMLSEVTDDSNAAYAFAFVGGMDGIARLTAPGIGGLLSQPNEQWDVNFALFDQFPFLLPNLVSAGVNALALLLCSRYLKETLPHSLRKANERRKLRQSMLVTHGTPPLLAEDDTYDEQRKSAGSLRSLLKHRNIAITVLLNSLLYVLALVINEGLPLVAVNDASHFGYSMSSTEIGLIFTCLGPAQFLCQFLIFPQFVKRVGFKQTLVYCLTMVGALSMLMPSIYYTQVFGRVWLWVALLTCFIFLVMHRSSAFTAVFAILSNVCTNEQKAAANGLSMSLASATGVVSPVIGGAILAWSINRESASYPFDHSLLWVVMSLVAWFAAALASRLPVSCNVKLEPVNLHR